MSTIKCLSFSQDDTCLGLGSDSSYCIYNCEPFGKCYDKKDEGGAKIVQMLFATSLIATVGLGYKLSSSTRKLRVINTMRNSVICELTFPTSVLFVRMNRKRLIVALIDRILIYDVACMKLLHTIETPNRESQVNADLSTTDNSILVFEKLYNKSQPSLGDFERQNATAPNNTSQASDSSVSSVDTESHPPGVTQEAPLGPTKSGSVILFDAISLMPMNIIQCHRSPLQTLTLSKDGTLLATASVKGTIVRVFSTSSGNKVYEFRRGSYSARITSLRFNADSSILACSSITGTIHLFRLAHRQSVGSSQIKQANAKPRVVSMPSPTVDANSDGTLPLRTVMTDEETFEISKLINDRMQSDRLPQSVTHRLLNRGKATGKVISQFLWDRSKNYLPPQINSMLTPKRDFAFIKLSREVASTVAVVGTNCYVATYDGKFYIYRIPSVKSEDCKECILLNEYDI